ncbi:MULTISPECIES: YopX family protein [unclassified Bacillus (in: firmicutes)]|uniref:YopX family protein n=1 Tax=unclassified Bacillus (in: firmicutes) TaxID=185979 RepID=UPI0008F43A3A|nr:MULTISPECIES: YopX family protein [unclassified Bacillus (in: firmicutes)]SFI02767.1 phage uncharacterized protein TIGR01671 [Bacillus sp. 71mf]SFS81545.1 phage uncharacterized protein TIGR01671 [Bacillus sp. 103mf]
MREIKFRAWDKVYKHFHEGDLIREYVIGEFIDNPEYEVTQYTGIKDKNCKEIYHKDIVRGHDNVIYIVEWDEKDAMFYYKDPDGNEDDDLRMSAVAFEVIGNIYENPELLKNLTK